MGTLSKSPAPQIDSSGNPFSTVGGEYSTSNSATAFTGVVIAPAKVAPPKPACWRVAIPSPLPCPPATRRCRLGQRWPDRYCPPTAAPLCAGAWPWRAPANRGFLPQSPHKTNHPTHHAQTARWWPKCLGSRRSSRRAFGQIRLF